MSSSTHKNAISFWRIVFTYFVLIIHFHNAYPILDDLGLKFSETPPDFFFLVSGFLLCCGFSGYLTRYKNAFCYTLHRYRVLWFRYALSLLLMFAVIILLRQNTLPPAKLFWHSLPEIFCVQAISPARGWDFLNPPLWYVSVMMVAGFLLFIFLKYFKKRYLQIVAPCLILAVFYLLFFRVGTLDVAVQMEGDALNYPLLRGLSDMTLGMYAAVLSDRLKEKNNKGLQIFGNLLLAAAIAMAFLFGKSKMSFLIVLFYAIGISVAFLPSSFFVFRAPWVSRLSRASYSIYLLHDIFRAHIFPYFFPPDTIDTFGKRLFLMIFYMVAVTLSAVLFEWIYQKMVLRIETVRTDWYNKKL